MNAIGNCPTTGDVASARPRKIVRSGVGGTPTVSGLYGGSTPCPGNCATVIGPTGAGWPLGMKGLTPWPCAEPMSHIRTPPSAPAARTAPKTNRLNAAILPPLVVGFAQPLRTGTE